MTSFVNIDYPTVHPGVARFEAVVASARSAGKGFNATKGLAVMLLAAIGAALLVVADQVVDTWADGHLLAAWVALWAVGIAALALFAGSVRSLFKRLVARLDAWSYRVAQARADQRLWAIAKSDPRVMADLQAAIARGTPESEDAAKVEQATAFSFADYASLRVPDAAARRGRAHLSYYL